MEKPTLHKDSRKGGQLGTFAGVFTPSILTILGLILFLRLGYVVGAAGLGRALLILAIANVISVLTSLSLSAVATNLRVKRGGDYYLISRTLGHEFGGAIGLVLFLAQAISIGFYCIGFAEVMASILPAPFAAHPHLIAATAAGLLFVFAWLGADWATRFQYLVMAILAAALVSFFAGGLMRWDAALLQQNWSAPLPATGFWVLFALFFPAVTGFTQGVSMSGDLKDPGRSLPLGTLLAVGLSILVYLCAAVVFAGTLPRAELVRDYEAMWRVALLQPLVVAGVFAATLSSAMASFMGAPRILQSLAEDRLFKVLLPFDRGGGPQNNQRRGINVWPLNPAGSGVEVMKYRFNWNFPTFFSHHDSDKLYAFSHRVHVSMNEGQSWDTISPDLTRAIPETLVSSGGPITQDNTSVEYYGTIFALAESLLEPGVIWTGSDDGLVHLTRDGGETWQDVTPRGLPEALLTSLEGPANDALRIVEHLFDADSLHAG